MKKVIKKALQVPNIRYKAFENYPSLPIEFGRFYFSSKNWNQLSAISVQIGNPITETLIL